MFKSIIYCFLLQGIAATGTLTPKQMQKLMGLGINLGNRLDLWQQPNKTVQEEFFDDFKKAGFTNVRIPVCWSNHTMMSSPYTIDPDFLDLVEQIVNWSLSRGMVTILNTHHEKWLDLRGWFDKKLPRFEAIWTQIAQRFKDHDQKLLFEIFNEPHLMTTQDLNTMNSAILPIIRKTNPSRIVLLMGLKNGNPSWLTKGSKSADFSIPDDKQLMMEIHNYDPFSYAGSNPTQKTWGSDDDYSDLNTWVSSLNDWASNRSIPIYYGEFAVTSAQTAATGSDKWYQAHAKVITENGWAASLWNDGSGHNIYDYSTRTWNKDILRDLGKSGLLTEAMPVVV